MKKFDKLEILPDPEIEEITEFPELSQDIDIPKYFNQKLLRFTNI